MRAASRLNLTGNLGKSYNGRQKRAKMKRYPLIDEVFTPLTVAEAFELFHQRPRLLLQGILISALIRLSFPC